MNPSSGITESEAPPRSPRVAAVSLRTKLVALLLAVEAVALASLVWQGWMLEVQRVERQFESSIAQMRPLLNAAIGPNLAAGNVALVQSILHEIQRSRGLDYVIVKDEHGRSIAAAGRAVAEPLPRLDTSLEGAIAEGRYDTVVPLAAEGRPLGVVVLGFPIAHVAQGLDDYLGENATSALGAFLLSLLIFFSVVQPLSRRIGRLERAAVRVGEGDYSVRVDDLEPDEVGRLARAFDRMAGEIRLRVRELEDGRQRLHAIADYGYDAELWIGADAELIWVNSSVERLTGYTPAECLIRKRFPWFPIHPEDLDNAHAECLRALGQRTTGTDYQFRIWKKDGRIEWVTSSWQPIYSPDGAFLGLRLSLNSIQKLKNVELDLRRTLSRLEEANALQAVTSERLRDERSRLISLLSAMSYGVVFVGRDCRIVYSNPAFAEAWGIPGSEPLLDRDLFEALHLAEGIAADSVADAGRLRELVGRSRETRTLEVRLASGRTLKVQVCPVADEECGFQGSVLIHEDITLQRESESRLAFLAERDPLTGLFNRRRFEQELAQRIEAAARSQETVALFFFDLDEFKSVNDLFGHRMGDTVLLQVAGEVRSQLRKGEFFARIGGDEFALIVTGADDDQLRLLANRLMRVIGELSVELGEVRISLTASLGIAVSPEHTRDAHELIAHADAAMYQAKDAGKNTWRIYRPGHAATLRQRSLVTWNERIRHALRHDGFEVQLQGVFATADRTRRYSEALIRMPDETGERLLPPSQFVPFAEKSNLIVDLDRWMINEVIGLLAADPQSEPIAVNISGRSFDEPEVAEFIAMQLLEKGVEPARLCIEITETAAIRDIREAQRFIDRLHHIGCKVCLDDFGSGFATFAYIKEMPVDVLKIDGMFIRNLARSRTNQVFVKAMLDIARGFDKLTVAEAVEDEASLDMLRDFGVDMVQGFVLERPQAASLRRAPPHAPAPTLLSVVRGG